jgi:hypothetical protein
LYPSKSRLVLPYSCYSPAVNNLYTHTTPYAHYTHTHTHTQRNTTRKPHMHTTHIYTTHTHTHTHTHTFTHSHTTPHAHHTHTHTHIHTHTTPHTHTRAHAKSLLKRSLSSDCFAWSYKLDISTASTLNVSQAFSHIKMEWIHKMWCEWWRHWQFPKHWKCIFT